MYTLGLFNIVFHSDARLLYLIVEIIIFSDVRIVFNTETLNLLPSAFDPVLGGGGTTVL